MAYSDDATKTWMSAVPKKNADGNVIEWRCKYRYTLNSYYCTFDEKETIETPSKAPSAYTKAELLTLMNKDHWDNIFNKRYEESIKVVPVATTDASFDVSTLDD